MSPPAIETRDLVRRHRGGLALDHLDVAIEPGGVHALIGRNGAGKSTLLRILVGFESASAGVSRVLGHDSAALPPEARGRIGFVADNHPLPGWMRVDEIAAFQRACHPRWSEATFAEITGLFGLARATGIGRLSRGERAGLALALAVAPGPELLLLDEPTAGLDPVASRAFLESLMFAGEAAPGTILFSSHRLAEVERVADDVLVLAHGKLVAAGAPDDVRARVTAWAIADWPAAGDPALIPGLLESRIIEDALHIVVLDAGPAFVRELALLGGRDVRSLPIGFERAMDALLAGAR